jgi:hypothetical protein
MRVERVGGRWPEGAPELAHASAPDLLALHGVRVMGFPTSSRIAARYRVDVDLVEDALLDVEARGWVRRLTFAGTTGWSLTDAGRVEDERLLSAELDRTGVRDDVASAHAAFRPLNRRFASACTDWQLRPTRLDPLAGNDHTDWRWDERVLATLASLGTSFGEVCDRLAACLTRFDGYADRYSAALRKVEEGRRDWVDAPDRDSLHIVWVQVHEDLLATLGIPRGSDS